MATSAADALVDEDGSGDRLSICVVKYRRLRTLTRDQLQEEIQRAYMGLKVSVEPITERALAFAECHWAAAGRRQNMDWRNVMRVLEKSHPRRLDLSFWHATELCGLAAIRLSDNKAWLSVTHLEGAPIAHVLKKRLATVALIGADIYSALLSSEDAAGRMPALRILNPLPQSMKAYVNCG